MNNLREFLGLLQSARWPLLRSGWLLVLLSAVLMYLAGPEYPNMPPEAAWQHGLFNLLSTFCLFIFWYRAHRVFIALQGETFKAHAMRFVFTQLAIIVCLSVLAATTVSVWYTVANFETLMHMNLQQDIVAPVMPKSYMVAAFIIGLLFYARLILVTSLAARGEGRAVRRSWRATGPHFFRLLGFAALFTLPAALAIATAETLLDLMPNHQGFVFATFINTTGMTLALALSAVQAEVEYKKLKP